MPRRGRKKNKDKGGKNTKPDHNSKGKNELESAKEQDLDVLIVSEEDGEGREVEEEVGVVGDGEFVSDNEEEAEDADENNVEENGRDENDGNLDSDSDTDSGGSEPLKDYPLHRAVWRRDLPKIRELLEAHKN